MTDQAKFSNPPGFVVLEDISRLSDETLRGYAYTFDGTSWIPCMGETRYTRPVVVPDPAIHTNLARVQDRFGSIHLG